MLYFTRYGLWHQARKQDAVIRRLIARVFSKKRQTRFRGTETLMGKRDPAQIPISPLIDINRDRLREAYGGSPDLIMRLVRGGPKGKIRFLVVHLDSLIDQEMLSRAVIQPLTEPRYRWRSAEEAYTEAKDRIILASDVKEVRILDELVEHLGGGSCGVLVDGIPRAIVIRIPGWEQRAVDEPTTEATIRGPKEGFIETLRVNTSILRRRIKDPRLRIEERTVGTVTRTIVALAYIDGLADPGVIQEARSRLEKIKVDSIQESGQIEEYIEDAPLSPFPTVLRTERPDKVVAALLEGRLAILTDGTPFVLIAPATFTMFLTASEDYYERFFIGSALRAVRFPAFLFSLTLPALYVAVTTFHQEMLPTPLILSIAAQREGIPFPAIVEAFLMEVLFEILREAGVRLPRIVGHAVSIIGALVIGEAAMRAGLVSAAMVVVVATTGIASFATPVFSIAIGARLLRFVMIALGGTLGFFGVVAGLYGLSIHLASLRSFGVPFLEPLAPLIPSDLKDIILRVPWWAMRTRPKLVSKKEPIRQAKDLLPRPGRGLPETTLSAKDQNGRKKINGQG